MSIKNSNDTIGNRIRDLPVRSAVPQPTAPPRAPNTYVKNSNFWGVLFNSISAIYGDNLGAMGVDISDFVGAKTIN
jgi:hypothetical protein